MEKRRVVITGLGMVTPLGNTTAETWAAARRGASGIGPITRFDSQALASRIAGEVKNFDPEAHIDKKEVKKMDLFSMYALAAGQEAWNAAKLADGAFEPSRMGCVLGVGVGGLGILEKFHETYLESGPRRISPFLIPAMITNLSSGHLAIRFGLRGVNFIISSACSSATHAIGESYRMIANGIQDVMLTGGAESTVTPMGIGGFCAMKALSTRNEEPHKASRPFDRDRDGFVLSEGAVIMVLESLESARKRKADIYAEVVGYGFSCDANHITAPCEDGAGAIACMQHALRDADLDSSRVDYVNAHGTSTPVGDGAETLAIKKVFGKHASEKLLVSSTKSMTGHLLGAAGAIEAGFCALTVKHNVVLPTINLDNPSEDCDLDYVAHHARELPINIAMSNSFGFGGTNATLIVSKLDN